MFAKAGYIRVQQNKGQKFEVFFGFFVFFFFFFFFAVYKHQIVLVCVDVLRPSQHNGVMASMVSLPNHTFTGQA